MVDAYLPLVESRLHRESPLILSGSYQVSGIEVTLTVDIEVDRQIRTMENQVDFFVCQDGLYGQSNMVVDVLTPEPFTLSEMGETTEVQRQFTMRSAWTEEALRLVVVVQDRKTQVVLQATLARDAAATPVPDELPQAAAVLHQAYPNPFNPSTTIGFSLARAGQVRLEVFSAAGRLLRTLVQRQLGVGDHEVVWQGNDLTGAPVASGTYYYRLSCCEASQTGSVTLVR